VDTSCLGQLRCEEWEFSHRLDGFGRCVFDRESGVPDWPESEVVWLDILLMLLVHRKSYFYSLNICYIFNIVHLKTCIWMVT
jgi:hypothetical protein